MVLNPFFTQGTSSEQNLVQDLINEQLRMYGVDIYYIPRKYMKEKTVIREVVQSKFDSALPIEAYVDNYDAYSGAGDVLSKFGIESKDEVRLIISRERYENYITPLIQGQSNIKLSTRPKGGDLIWFPLDDRLYEIKDIEYAKPYYQLQNLYVYELYCELFQYQDEVIATGIEDIDNELLGDETDGLTEDGISTVQGITQTLTMVGNAVQATAANQPKIAENGALICVPTSWPIPIPKNSGRNGAYWTHCMGYPRSALRAVLDSLPKTWADRYQPLVDLSVDDVMALTQLDARAAARALRRDFTETLVWHGSDADFDTFSTLMTDRGLQCVRGGRFVHLMGPNNKARAMEWLQLAIGHYLGGEVVSIGIGDADNDRSLLEATDIALLVKSPVHAFPVLDRTDNTFHSRLCGPEGWVEGVETIMTTLLGKEALA